MYCDKCLTTNLRPNAKFIGSTCEPCLYALNPHSVNYEKRLMRLVEKIEGILKTHSDEAPYDCVVGVSGGKDSTRQALWVRDHLKLRPLLVCCSYPPSQMLQIGAENLSNLLEHGFDLEIINPAPKSARALSREAFSKFGNVCKASEIALFTSVPKIAISKKIPLAFFGENPALQEGDSKTMGVDEFDANNLRFLNTLSDGGIDWITKTLDKKRVQSYYYPDSSDFEEANLSMLYLGPAWSDWDMHENAVYSVLNGLEPRPGEEKYTGDLTNASMLDEEFTNINMMIKYYKFGFGRATDLCNELIRQDKISRQSSIELVKNYDGICSDEIIEKYCEWIEISVEEFWATVVRYTNKSLFDTSTIRPKRLFEVGFA